MTVRTGSCLCGAFQYRITVEPLAARICWCKDCQKLAENGTVNILVPSESVECSGELSSFDKLADSGDTVKRSFCPTCGSHLFSNTLSTPELTIIRAGTLSDPSSIRPTSNIWVSSAPDWSCIDSSLEMVDKQPVSTAE